MDTLICIHFCYKKHFDLVLIIKYIKEEKYNINKQYVNQDAESQRTIEMDGYTITLKFQDLSNIQTVFENLVQWHIENDKE